MCLLPVVNQPQPVLSQGVGGVVEVVVLQRAEPALSRRESGARWTGVAPTVKDYAQDQVHKYKKTIR
jgi:hypothetical protein